MRKFDLTGKTALVTGAKGGIGGGIAQSLYQSGAAILAVDLPSPRAALTSLCSDLPGTVEFQCDLTNRDDVEALFLEIDRQGKHVDILINSAGIARPETILETSLESWNEVLAANLTSTFLCAKAAMVRMARKGAGRIIQLGSVVGHQGALKGHLHYGVSKSGVHGFTHTLARTAAPLGITVNAIAPGLVGTQMLYSTHGEDGVKELENLVPLGRLATVREIGDAAVFLASDEAAYITGVVLDINGGLYMR